LALAVQHCHSIFSLGRSTFAAMSDWGNQQSEQESLVSRVKEIQRSDPSGKIAWWNYADKIGGGVRDPAKNQTDSLQTFLSQYDSGAFANVDPQDAGALGELFKEGQRSSGPFKTAWSSFQTMQGNKMHDPLKAGRDNLVAFLDFMGTQAMNAMSIQSMMGKGPMMGGKGKDKGMEKGKGKDMMMMQMMSAKGAMMSGKGGKGGGRDDSWSGDGSTMGTKGGKMGGKSSGDGWGEEPAAKRQKAPPASSGDPQKDALVDSVKNFQRSGEAQKQAWWTFCDSQESKNRDPARYDTETLWQFAQGYGLQI